MKRRFTYLATILLVIAVMVTLAWAGLKTVTDRITYTDKQIFRSDVDFNGPNPAVISDVWFGPNSTLTAEGATDDAYELIFAFTDPTSDITITFPNATGKVALEGRKDLAYTNGSGFAVSAADAARYSVFLVTDTLATEAPGAGQGPSDGAGVTVYLSAPTSVTDGRELTFIKHGSGTTDIFLYFVGGLPIDVTSATTDKLTIDAAGDAITIILAYNSAVSAYIKSSHIS